METKFIEVTQTANFNWGKFMVARWDDEEWSRKSAMGHGILLREVGWTQNHITILDLQTGEGIVVRPGGLARADLNDKHQVWVCPMFEPFLEWLYTQDVSDLQKLPDKVTLDTKESAVYGYRRNRGGKAKKKATD